MEMSYEHVPKKRTLRIKFKSRTRLFVFHFRANVLLLPSYGKRIEQTGLFSLGTATSLRKAKKKKKKSKTKKTKTTPTPQKYRNQKWVGEGFVILPH